MEGPVRPPRSASLPLRERLRSKLWNDAAHPSIAYVFPFAVFLLFLAGSSYLPVSPAVESPFRVCVLALVCWVSWPRGYSLRPRAPLTTVLFGAAVFLLWIGPDVLWPGYRHSILFTNSLFGLNQSPVLGSGYWTPWLLVWRFARAALIVPVVEELFWRAWLMRWLIRNEFLDVPLGTFEVRSFLTVAILFAFEHGSYWDVGLLTGILYNWWMVRTKSLADCILAHAITNACLSAYVIAQGQWQYW